MYYIRAKVSNFPYSCKERLYKTLFFRETLHIKNKNCNFAPHFHFGKMISSVMVN
ncbi:hypothetical protein HMPREF0645_1644 [Hallella bergensis DSM 17361]|uniref:Uncharacterized protein n=1 Tax=Hallella bergensis DSM 17361 TaxID=585502 RepID=D1PXF9_9BACT|nr:hypothetical protein HMPREF0645_1644 [Hallella bergensis DSM 17361]